MQDEENNVLHDLLRGEVTQEVRELRHEMYYAERESHKYKYTGNGTAVKKNSLYDGGNIRFIYVDELLQLSVILFIATMLTWDDKQDDLETYSYCFRFSLFLLNDVCIFGDAPNETIYQNVLPRFLKDIHIVELAEDCFWTIMAFTLAHELAHEYLSSQKEMSGSAGMMYNGLEEEFEADRIAYDILLNSIIEAKPNAMLLMRFAPFSGHRCVCQWPRGVASGRG